MRYRITRSGVFGVTGTLIVSDAAYRNRPRQFGTLWKFVNLAFTFLFLNPRFWPQFHQPSFRRTSTPVDFFSSLIHI